MNSHLTSPRPNARVRRGSKRSNMGQIQVCNFNYYQNNEIFNVTVTLTENRLLNETLLIPLITHFKHQIQGMI